MVQWGHWSDSSEEDRWGGHEDTPSWEISKHLSKIEELKETIQDLNHKIDYLSKRNLDIHAFFDTVIDSEAFAGKGSGGSDRYLSEDYMFCQFTRKIGIKTFLCPWMKLGHIGSYVFNGTLPSLANLDYAAHGMDTTTRPQLVTKEEEEAVEQEAGRKLSRAERRKMARDKRKKKS